MAEPAELKLRGKFKELKAVITSTGADTMHPGRLMVGVQLTDKDGAYTRHYSLLRPDHPMSLEEFAIYLSSCDLSRPVDPFIHIKEAAESGTEFAVKVTDGIAEKGDNQDMVTNPEVHI